MSTKQIKAILTENLTKAFKGRNGRTFKLVDTVKDDTVIIETNWLGSAQLETITKICDMHDASYIVEASKEECIIITVTIFTP